MNLSLIHIYPCFRLRRGIKADTSRDIEPGTGARIYFGRRARGNYAEEHPAEKENIEYGTES